MIPKFKSFKKPSELQQRLYELLPIGSSIDTVKYFSIKNETTWSGLYPKSSLAGEQLPDIDFDSRVTCTTQAASDKFPLSIISFSNGWIWLIYFYFLNDKLIKIDVEMANNGL